MRIIFVDGPNEETAETLKCSIHKICFRERRVFENERKITKMEVIYIFRDRNKIVTHEVCRLAYK